MLVSKRLECTLSRFLISDTLSLFSFDFYILPQLELDKYLLLMLHDIDPNFSGEIINKCHEVNMFVS